MPPPSASADSMPLDEELNSAFRRRAVSEVVRNGSSRWRIVAAWSSLRRSWDNKTSSNDAGASDFDSDDDATAELPPDAPAESVEAPPPPSDRRPPAGAASSASSLPTASEHSADAADASSPPLSKKEAGGAPHASKPRKRVSLFLRRRARFRDGGLPQSLHYGAGADADDDGPESGEVDARRFRRAQSHLLKPVSISDTDARFSRPRGEAGRYLEYAREFDDDSFEALRDRTLSAFRKLRPAAIRLAPGVSLDVPPSTNDAACAQAAAPKMARPPSDAKGAGAFEGLGAEDVVEADAEPAGEIIGEICLEDFADDGSDDFDFLDGQIVDVWTEGEGADGKPSLRLDGQQGWFGEKEFAAFCEEVGLHEFFEVPKPSEKDLDTFRVGDEKLDQWRDDVRIHNSLAARWGAADLPGAVDVRELAAEWAKREHGVPKQGGAAKSGNS